MNYSDRVIEGSEVEKEHKSTYLWIKQSFEDGVLISENAMFAHIAMDHIEEHSDYYKRLKEAGL